MKWKEEKHVECNFALSIKCWFWFKGYCLTITYVNIVMFLLSILHLVVFRCVYSVNLSYVKNINSLSLKVSALITWWKYVAVEFKWRIFSQTGLEQSGEKKSGFFLLGLKYTLRTCFGTKKFLPKSCPELSNQVLSFSACQIC